VPPDSGNQIPKFGTFCGRFELLINSNAWRWWIPTNMLAKMKSFKSEKRFTVLNRFLKIKEAFMVKLKMISVDHYFRPHQIPKIFFKKHFTQKQADHKIKIGENYTYSLEVTSKF